MAQWKRTDLEIKALIIERLINWDLWSNIAKDLWVDEATVSRIKNNDLQEVASENTLISELVTRNNNLQSAGDALIAEMIASKADWITIAQLTSLRQSTFTQNQLIQWKPTDNNKIEIIFKN